MIYSRVLNFFLFILFSFSTHGRAQLFPYKMKTGRFCYTDSAMTKVIHGPYDFAYPFEYGRAQITINNKCGVIDASGKLVIPLKYDQIIIYRDYYIVRIGGAYGFLKSDGSVLTPVKYYSFNPFNHGIAHVFATTDHPDFINRQGKELIPKTHYYKNANNGYIVAEAEATGKMELIDSTGKISLRDGYDEINIMHPDFIIAYKEGKPRYFPLRPDVEVAASKMNEIFASFPVTRAIYNQGSIAYKLGDKMGLVDINLNPITDEKYRDLQPCDNGDWIYQMPNTYRYGFLNSKGEELTPPDFDQVKYVPGASMIAVRKNDKWGVLNTNYSEIIPFQYSGVSDYYINIISCMAENKYHVFNNKGSKLFELNSSPTVYSSHNIITSWNKETKKSTIYDMEGNVLLEGIGGFNTEYLKGNTILDYNDGKYRLRSLNGQFVNDSEYTDPYTYTDLYLMYLGDDYIYVSPDGKEFIEK